MAVFTPVSASELAQWMQRFDLGTPTELTPIVSGIENTNYFVDTDRGGRFVLTLVERIGTDALPFFLQLMKHLAQRGIRCPDPMMARDGTLHGVLNGKPATLVTRLAGSAVEAPEPVHCHAVGKLLARMHEAARDFPGAPANPRGAYWWPIAAQRLMPVLAPAQRQLMEDEMAAQLRWRSGDAYSRLPRSAVHADLFRDNVLFDGRDNPGPIDFFFACDEDWMFDLAVCCNDWCVTGSDGVLDADRRDALLMGYCQVRRPSNDEWEAWPMALRAAALRFWMSRLFDWHFGREASLLTPKDPRPMQTLLEQRRSEP